MQEQQGRPHAGGFGPGVPLDPITMDARAAAERINTSCVTRRLRLTLLAPDIVEAGRMPAGITLPGLINPLSVERGRQH